MNYLYETLDAPTRLYIKRCSHCGLKYFGKTFNENIEKYPGSGVYWTQHLRKHGGVSIHVWESDWYYDTSITRFALKFSKINKIVESKNWANLREEDGINGGSPSTETRDKLSKSVSATVNDPAWKNEIGEERLSRAKISISFTMNDENWKMTTGKERSEKISQTKSLQWSDPIWKEQHCGKEWSESHSKKLKKTFNDPEWKRKNYKKCERCGWYGDPGNYGKHHGEKCKKGKQ